MKRKLILTLALMVGANCAKHPAPETGRASNENEKSAQPIATVSHASATAASDDSVKPGESKDAPPEFRNIDFKNFAYPISWHRLKIRLADGKYEYYHDKKIDEYGGGWLNFDDVDYVDVTGDGKKEAIVYVDWVACGGSCDGGSVLIYIYSMRHGRLSLVWHMETGSTGYGCGLKSFVVNEQIINLEVFKKCMLNATETVPAPDADEKFGGKFIANDITSFTFRFNGRTFVLKKRRTFPNGNTDVKNYHPTIRVSDG